MSGSHLTPFAPVSGSQSVSARNNISSSCLLYTTKQQQPNTKRERSISERIQNISPQTDCSSVSSIIWIPVRWTPPLARPEGASTTKRKGSKKEKVQHEDGGGGGGGGGQLQRNSHCERWHTPATRGGAGVSLEVEGAGDSLGIEGIQGECIIAATAAAAGGRDPQAPRVRWRWPASSL